MALKGDTLGDLRKRALGMLDSSDADNHFGTLVNQWLNNGLMEMHAVVEGIEKKWTTSCVVGQRNYELPDDFMRPKLVLYNGIPIRFLRLEDVDFYSSGNTYVNYYTIWGGTTKNQEMVLGPLPPQNTYTLTVYYYAEPDYMEQDSDEPQVPNRFRQYLAHYAAAQMFLVDGRADLASTHMELYNRGVDKYRNYMKDKKERSTGSFVSIVY